MKVIIIGTIVRDRLKFYDGTESSSLGGLLHTLNAARVVLGPKDQIFPVSRVGKDLYPELLHTLAEDPRIQLDGLVECDQPNNTVELIYRTKEERIEHSLFPMPPLCFAEVESMLDGDLFLVNMISGWDIELDFLWELRNKTSAMISMDIHSLTLERSSDGTRRFRHFEFSENWTAHADIIQMNEREFEAINRLKLGPAQFFRATCIDSNKIINLTKGAKGSETYRIYENNIAEFNLKPPHGINVIDPTGCGDVFLAVFGITYYQTKNLKFSAQQANLIAAITGKFKGLHEPGEVRKIMREYPREEA